MDETVSGVGVEAVNRARDSGTIFTQFDQERTPPSIAIIATLADVMDTDPVEMEPLHYTIDPDELDSLVQVRTGMTGDTHVTFTKAGYTITVHSYGMISITPDHELPGDTDDV